MYLLLEEKTLPRPTPTLTPISPRPKSFFVGTRDPTSPLPPTRYPSRSNWCRLAWSVPVRLSGSQTRSLVYTGIYVRVSVSLSVCMCLCKPSKVSYVSVCVPLTTCIRMYLCCISCVHVPRPMSLCASSPCTGYTFRLCAVCETPLRTSCVWVSHVCIRSCVSSPRVFLLVSRTDGTLLPLVERVKE